jgi:hypothetical protein
MHRMFYLIISSVVLAGCASNSVAATPTFTSSSRPIPTNTETLIPTATLTATSTPIPLPLGATSIIQEGEVIYAIDENGHKIYRQKPGYDPQIDPEFTQWQEKFDLSFLKDAVEKDLEAWVVSNEIQDISEGDFNHLNQMKQTVYDDEGFKEFAIEAGYLSRKTVVEVTDGFESTQLTSLGIKYFVEDGVIVEGEYIALNSILAAFGDVDVSLGSKMLLFVVAPDSTDGFSSSTENLIGNNSGLSEFERNLLFKGFSFPDVSVVDQKLTNFQDGIIIDLRSALISGSYVPPPK